MARRDDLFDLINTMSKSEKRYFKVVANQYSVGRENKYVVLFDHISKQKEYDEASVKKSLKDEMLRKNFAVEKNYLYNYLLKTITSFHGNKNLNAKASSSLYTIRLLTSKLLFHQSRKLINKTLKFVEKSENHTLHIELLKLKIDVLEEFPDEQEAKNQTYLEIFSVHKIQENVFQYRYYNDLMYDLMYRTFSESEENEIKKTTKEIAKILDHELFSSEEKGLCNEAKIKFNETFAMYYYLKQDFSSAFKFSQRSLEIVNDTPYFKEEKQSDYSSVLNNNIVFAGILKKFDIAIERNKLLKDLMTNEVANRNNVDIFSSTALIDTNFFIQSGEPGKIHDEIDSINYNLKLFGSKVLIPKLYALYFNLMLLYFLNGEFSQAVNWVNKIIHDKEPDTHTHILAYSHLFNLLIHFELKNYDYLEDHLMKSTYKYLSNKEQLTEVIIVLNTLLNELIISTKKTQKSKALTLCLEQLNAKKCADELEAGRCYEVKLWVESKLNKEDFHLLIKDSNVI